MDKAANSRGAAGWLILVLALAIPGLLFFNWWSKMNAKQKKDLAVAVRKRTADLPFSGATNKNKLSNPVASDPAVAAPPDAAAAASLAVAAAAPPAVTTAAVVALPGAAALPASGIAASPLAAPIPAAAVAAASDAVRTEAAPGMALDLAAGFPTRDPMLSPYDLVRIEIKRGAAQAAAQALLDAKNKANAPPVKRKRYVAPEPPIEDSIDLQGIISNAEGENKAIVNDNLVGEGDLVGKVRILKITAQAVVFIYKNKRFTRTVNK